MEGEGEIGIESCPKRIILRRSLDYEGIGIQLDKACVQQDLLVSRGYYRLLRRHVSNRTYLHREDTDVYLELNLLSLGQPV